MSAALMKRFRELCGAKLDISEHLGLLRGLACDPDVRIIAELGFRSGVSATALATADKHLFCVDIDPCAVAVRELRKMAPKFMFIQRDSLKVEIPECELLHIDSLHTHDHLLAELRLHHSKCRRWIALHDTATFAYNGKDGSEPGLIAAIDTFLKERPEWKIHLHLWNNNGLTVLQRLTAELSIPL